MTDYPLLPTRHDFAFDGEEVYTADQMHAYVDADRTARAQVTDTKIYSDGTMATGPGPLPPHSPEQQRLLTLLDCVEAMLGGANGPTIQIRAALAAQQTQGGVR